MRAIEILIQHKTKYAGIHPLPAKCVYATFIGLRVRGSNIIITTVNRIAVFINNARVAKIC